jgi:N-acetylneuraminic acid mutarotase
MKKHYLVLSITTLISNLLLTTPLHAQQGQSHIKSKLPEAVSNNAVTQVSVGNRQYLLSFSGLAKSKGASDVHNKTYVFDIEKNSWHVGSPVPIANPINELSGRLASVATAINEIAYVFGGYTVAKDHSEVSVPDVYAYHVDTDSYRALAPMPVPVDDSVALPYQDRYVYLVSGWHNDGNVNLVQVYDTTTNSWQQASPFPGKPVFGQAAGIVNNTLVICDGVRVDVHIAKRRNYAAEAACYVGKIADNNPAKISWQKLAHPTGVSRYRMAAAGDNNTGIISFIGGSNNPYNYNGIGYNGVPSKPSNEIWQYHIKNNQWQVLTTNNATMDHRGLLNINGKLVTLGGMGHKQQVLDSINYY